MRAWHSWPEQNAEQPPRPVPSPTSTPSGSPRCRDEQQAAYDALRERGLALDLTRGKPSTAQLDLSDAAVAPPGRRPGPRGCRCPQLRRARGHPRDPRDVRRPAVGRAGAGRGGRQLQPGDDARGPRRPRAQGRGRQRAAVGPRGEGDLHLPGARLRPALHAAELARHRHRDGPDERRRPRRRCRRGAGREGPHHQGHVGRPDPRQPDRLDRLPGGRGPARVDADGSAGLQDLLGQRLRLPPPHRGGGQERGHPARSPPRRATRTGRSCSPRPPRSPTPAPASRSWRAPPRPWRGTSATSARASIGPDKVNQLRHVQFFGSPQGVRDHMRRHREIIAPKFEAVARGARASGSAGRASPRWTKPSGRLLRESRRAARHGRPRHRARQGRRCRPHPGRLVVPAAATTPTTPTSASPPPSPSSPRSGRPWTPSPPACSSPPRRSWQDRALTPRRP